MHVNTQELHKNYTRMAAHYELGTAITENQRFTTEIDIPNLTNINT